MNETILLRSNTAVSVLCTSSDQSTKYVITVQTKNQT